MDLVPAAQPLSTSKFTLTNPTHNFEKEKKNGYRTHVPFGVIHECRAGREMRHGLSTCRVGLDMGIDRGRGCCAAQDQTLSCQRFDTRINRRDLANRGGC